MVWSRTTTDTAVEQRLGFGNKLASINWSLFVSSPAGTIPSASIANVNSITTITKTTTIAVARLIDIRFIGVVPPVSDSADQ